MQSSLLESTRLALERYLTQGTASASRDDVLLIRRARGFGLIGLAVAFFAGFVPGLTHGITELALSSLALMLFMVVGLWLGFVRDARYIRPVTHLGMGAILAGIFLTSIGIRDASEVSVIFPMLLIMVITYVLGVRSAFCWTLATIAGSGLTVILTDLPSTSAESLITAPGLFASRAVALFATFGFAAAERRVADSQSEKLEFLAGHDSLTGLLNRRAFEERLVDAFERCRRYDRRLGLIMIDLDEFKPVNDAHGHAVGDEVLRRLARRIAKLTRRTDSVCRMGGDEFLVLVEDVQAEKDVELHADRLLATLMRPIELEGARIEVSASIGVALQREVGAGAEALIQRADRAMYEAKSAGGAGIRSHPAVHGARRGSASG
jgi:diguanylate cyclase (GGDEF)-like protein